MECELVIECKILGRVAKGCVYVVLDNHAFHALNVVAVLRQTTILSSPTLPVDIVTSCWYRGQQPVLSIASNVRRLGRKHFYQLGSVIGKWVAVHKNSEKYSKRCLSAAMVDNHYNVHWLKLKMTESQQSWMWSAPKVYHSHGSRQAMSVINFVNIHKLVYEISCLQNLQILITETDREMKPSA